jgi:hypothetical protein
MGFSGAETQTPLQVADSSPQWSYLRRKISQRLFFAFWLLFSNNGHLYSDSVAPVICPQYPSTPFPRYTLCKAHVSVQPSYAAPRIPSLSLLCLEPIWQLFVAPGLERLCDILCTSPNTLPHIREWGILAMCMLCFWYWYKDLHAFGPCNG